MWHSGYLTPFYPRRLAAELSQDVGLREAHHQEALAAGGNICDERREPEGWNLDVQ